MAHGDGAATLAPAFAAPVFDAAHAFRAILSAMSQPGTIVTIDAPDVPPAPMGRAMAAVLLTLCDLDTPVWLAAAYHDAIGRWSDFHVGAPRVLNASDAAFVFAPVGDAPDVLSLDAGDEAYPDRSATLVLECGYLGKGTPRELDGPGIDGTRRFGSDALTEEFVNVWAQNRARFPRGVDVLLTCGHHLAGLPRTTQIRATG